MLALKARLLEMLAMVQPKSALQNVVHLRLHQDGNIRMLHGVLQMSSCISRSSAADICSMCDTAESAATATAAEAYGGVSSPHDQDMPCADSFGLKQVPLQRAEIPHMMT